MLIPKLANRIIEYAFYTLFFLVPLIMTPFNYELFEFNKMLLVYALTIVIAGAWLIKMLLAKRVLFRRTPLDIPIIFFLISQFLSFFFSIDRHTSLWGYYGRFHGGLLSTISYIVLYYAFVSNIYHLSSIIYHLRIVLVSGFLVSMYGILEHFGIDDQYWVQDVRNRVFSTIGQPNWLAAYLAILLPIAMTFAINEKLKMKNEKRQFKIKNFTFTFLLLPFYFCLLYTRSRSGFLGFWIAEAIFLSLIVSAFLVKRGPQTPETTGLIEEVRNGENYYHDRAINFRSLPLEIFKKLLFINLIFLLITFFIGTPFEKINRYFSWQGLTSLNISHITYHISPIIPGGTESGEIRKIVWRGAIDIWRHYPIFGSGVETFAYSYYQYRPKEHNLTSEWDFLYNKAHNEYLNYLATTGLVGLVGYLSIILAFIAWFFRISNLRFLISKQIPNPKSQAPKKLGQLKIRSIRNFLLIGLFSGWASILLTNFFGFSVVPVALSFFLTPAIAFVIADQTLIKTRKDADHHKKTIEPFNHLTIRQLNISQKFLILLILLFTFYFLLFTFKLWFADFAYAKGRSLNQLGQYEAALVKLQTSIRLNPGEPVYKEEIASSLANLAFLAQQQKLEALSEQLTQKAISFNDQAIEISPYNLNFWKGRAKMFYILSQIDKKYFERALTALTTAHMLAPTDAKVAYNLGLVLGQVGENEKAIEVLKKTVELKPDYRNARYGLALFYHEAGFDQAATDQLEYILDNIATDDGEAMRKLEEWRQ